MVTLPQTSSIHKHPIKKNIMTSQNDSFIKTQNHRQEQPRDTHSLTSQSSQRIQVVARTPTTKWQAQLTAHSFSHGLDLEGMSHRHPKPWIKSRCFLTTKCLAPEGKSHTHRKQSLPKSGNSLHLGPILKNLIQMVSQVFARCNLGWIHKAYRNTR